MNSTTLSHAYPRLDDKLRVDDQYNKNAEENLKSLETLDAVLAKARAGGGEKYTDRHLAKGKLLPRERIELLLDPDSHFLELCPIAGYNISGHAPGASIIGGIGIVSGVECLISASDSTIKGGAISEFGVTKSARLSEIAAQNRLPSIHLTESAGADLPNQSNIFVRGGAAFRDLSRASAQRRPTICLVFGSSTAGGAYIPGMSDYVVMVKEQAQVYLAGPPLVKMATGEESGHEELGGAQVHATQSGVADYLAEDEHDAIRLGREIVAHLDWQKAGRLSPRVVEEPHYAPEPLPTSRNPLIHGRSLRASPTDHGFPSSSLSTEPHSSAVGRTFTATPSESSPTTASSLVSPPTRALSSFSSAIRAILPCSSFRTSQASWSARSMSRVAS